MTEDLATIDRSELYDEYEHDEGLESAYHPGVTAAVVFEGENIDKWKPRWWNGWGVSSRILIAGKHDWHASQYSALDQRRTAPKRELSIAINPETHFGSRRDCCVMTETQPAESVARQKLIVMAGAVMLCVLTWPIFLPIDGMGWAILLGIEHGLLLGLYLCTFYGWRIHDDVSWIKYAIQLRKPWVLTNGALFREIEKRNKKLGLGWG